MSKNVKKILAATTLDESSDHVVTAGHELARVTGAELYLLHAYAMPAAYYGSPMGMSTVYPYAVEGERERIEQRFGAQLRRLDLDPDQVTGKVFEVGAPHRLLISASKDLEVDLVLVGASESHGALAPLLGSTADRVLRQSHIPVWVVRQGFDLPLERVMALNDLSELSEESLRRGLAILDDVVDVHPKLVTVFVLSNLERVGSQQFSPDQVERFARKELERSLQALRDETGWDSAACLRTGVAREEVLAELGKNPSDLVVVGTHGRSGFERLLVGSVAADVVRHAPCSVLVVPPAAARDRHPVGEAADRASKSASAVH